MTAYSISTFQQLSTGDKVYLNQTIEWRKERKNRPKSIDARRRNSKNEKV